MRRRSRADRAVRLSRVPRASRRAPAARGFTLIEATVSLIILVIVMVVVLSLLFSMKSFAEKQQAFTAPRQTARRALDYVSSTLAGAADWNQITGLTGTPPTAGNPFALVMFVEWGNTGAGIARRQSSFNNLAGTETGNSTFVVNTAAPVAAQVTATKFGTAGTDVISVAYPSAQVSPVKIPITLWTGGPAASAVTIALNFAGGCGVDLTDPTNPAKPGNVNDQGNIDEFRRTVGAVQETDGAKAWVSSVLILADGNGAWRLVQLTGVTPAASGTLTSSCAQKQSLSPPGNGQIITATLKDASTVDQYFAPGGMRTDLIATSAFLIAGIDFVSFRHRTILDPTDPSGVRVIGQLEQKSSGIAAAGPQAGKYVPGFFDPTLDGLASSNFTPIVDNVDDFQVAYILRDGSVWNTAAQTFDNGGTKVPAQARTPAVTGQFQPDCRGTDLTAAAAGGTNLDVACVVGMRVNVVGRSLPMGMGSRGLSGVGGTNVVGGATISRYRSLSVEDHPAGTTAADDTVATGIYDRIRLTTTVMLRNRALGF